MATNSKKIEQQQARLKLKSEQLNLRVKIADAKDRHQAVTQQLKNIGGRIR